MNSEIKTKNKIKEIIAKAVFMLAAAISVIAVVSIIIFLFARGLPAIFKIGLWDFIFGKSWNPNGNDTFNQPLEGQYGILPMIVGSAYAVGGAILIGGSLGFFSAVFIAMFCPKNLKKPLKQIINLLAGIPSVIYGFFGMEVISPFLGKFSANGSGSGVLAVSIILGIMILPTVTALTTTGLEAVDKSYYEGAIALGAKKEQAVFKVVVPAAKSSILAALILGVGRALGETMAVVMIAGNNTVFPKGLLSSFRTMTANIVMEMSYAPPFHTSALIATGCVLFVFVLIINLAFSAINLKSYRKKINKRSFPQTLAASMSPNGSIDNHLQNNNLQATSVGTISSRQVMHQSDITIKENLWHNEKLKISSNKLTAILLKIFAFVAALIAVFALIFILLFILIRGIPHLKPSLLFGKFTYSGSPTILPSIVATLMMVLLSSLISFPLGVFTAIYLNEYTKKNNVFVKIARVAVDILGGVPSIIYGLFGMLLFTQFLKLGTSILAGSLTISLMTIPTTVRATEEALKAVPNSLREGSFALGGGKLRTIYKVVLPSALPGILSAVILGIGKMFAESAPFLFTMGASLKSMPRNYFSSGATLAVALFALAREGQHINEAYATACILIFLVLAINLIATLLVNKLQAKLLGKSDKKERPKKTKNLKA